MRSAPSIEPAAHAWSSAMSRRMFSAPGAGSSRISRTSDVEPEVHHVAVVHHVVAPLEPLLAQLAYQHDRAGGQQVLDVHDLGADESPGEVRMDGSCSIKSGTPLAECPRANLSVTGREEREQPEQVICGSGYAVEPRFAQADVGEECRAGGRLG